ncbi:MAG: type VII toxin-antitoxin system HepT family RNase toxin [Desulfovermiculus sp.]
MRLDPDRVRTKLLDITRALDRLRSIQSQGQKSFLADEDSQDIARSRLLIAIEAALNVCYHTAAKKLHQVPEDYAQCFQLLGEAGLIPKDLASRLSMMARFRNRLVHMYWDIDYSQIYEILSENLKDLDEFSQVVSTWL